MSEKKPSYWPFAWAALFICLWMGCDRYLDYQTDLKIMQQQTKQGICL